MSLHTPERLTGESFTDYKARRAASNQVGRDMQRDVNHGLANSRHNDRVAMRRSGTMGKRTRAYRALMAAWAQKRVPKWRGPRDDHGVVFLIGRPYELEGVHPTSRELVLEGWVDGDAFGYKVQRKWLAGISAQRGY